jgi:mono/diheme cytochrome c family protein
MKLHRILVTAATVASVLAAVLALTGAAGRAGDSRAAQVERGRYLTLMGGCNDCHTPGTFYGAADYSRQLSGSELGWLGPWGVTFPRNLTPDVETGLGKWSDRDIVNALRTGVRPDGSVILPPMPWPMYATMTDADAFAIAAYLKSLPPVKHRAPDRIAPGVAYDGPAMRFPPPPAWDAPRAEAAATDVH